jgi:hypothetical protein
MRRATIAFALAALVGALTVPAVADVFVTVNVEKEKDVFVFEEVVKFKFVDIFVFMERDLEGAAEAQAIANQRNNDNISEAADPQAVADLGVGRIDPNDMRINKHARISNSINNNTGIVGVNQDVGNMVNQANVVAAAVTNSESALTHSQAEVDQQNFANFSFHRERVLNLVFPNLTANITGSINNNRGVVGVNQNAGNMNNQANLVALSVGLGSEFALSEAALGQINRDNRVTEVQTVKFDLIQNSINGNSGIIGVNQSVGNMNNQASAVSVSALTSTVTLTTPFGR